MENWFTVNIKLKLAACWIAAFMCSWDGPIIRVGKLFCIFISQSSHIQSHKEGTEWTIVDPEIKSQSSYLLMPVPMESFSQQNILERHSKTASQQSPSFMWGKD